MMTTKFFTVQIETLCIFDLGKDCFEIDIIYSY